MHYSARHGKNSITAEFDVTADRRRLETSRRTPQKAWSRPGADLPPRHSRARHKRRRYKLMSRPITMRPISDNRYLDITLPGPLLGRILLWLFIFAVFPLSVTAASLSWNLEVRGRTTSHTRTCGERTSATRLLSERILARLEASEQKESDPWLRDDIRIAWITTLYASQGNPQAHVDATYRVLGLHPDKVWPAICARRAALLGRQEYPTRRASAEVPAAAVQRSPKKPSASERRTRQRKVA